MTLNLELLEILACPQCKGSLTLIAGNGLSCSICDVVYPVKEGIPIMLIDEAIPRAEWDACKQLA